MRRTMIEGCLAALVLVAAACCGIADADRDGTMGATDTTGDTPIGPPVGTTSHVELDEPILAGSLPAEAAVDETDRPQLALSGDWQFRFDDEDVGVEQEWFGPASDRASWDRISVPMAWDFAHPEGFDRQTVAWYARTFASPGDWEFVRLRFLGVFREARVWLNGEELGGSDLPYLPFSFEITDVLESGGDNLLVVRVDNRISRTTLPCDTTLNPGKHGWFPYGGLLRPVELEGSLPIHVARVAVTAEPEGSFAAFVRFYAGSRSVDGATAEARLLRDETTVVAWPPFEVPAEEAAVRLSAELTEPDLWSPETPGNRYRLEIVVENAAGAAETVGYDIAFKRFEVRDGRFYLNGEERFLRGINRHEDDPELGPLFDSDRMSEDVALLRELNVDFMRPGHYPNDVRTLRALEDAGFMLAEEIPVYQLEEYQLADAGLQDMAVRALERMITRDRNRPGIVMWSLANEIWSWLPPAAVMVGLLNDRAKELDPDRPTMLAAVTAPPLSQLDQASGIVDAIGINEYFGWYYDETEALGAHLDMMHELFPDRALFISEYGCGALLGRHLVGEPGEEPIDDHSYTEEYQMWFHERHTDQFLERPFIRGMMPWVFADFRMQWNPSTGNPHPADRKNLKGLVSDTRERKAAFAFIAALYETLGSDEL